MDEVALIEEMMPLLSRHAAELKEQAGSVFAAARMLERRRLQALIEKAGAR